MDLKSVHHINQKDRDIVCGYIRKAHVQLLFDDNPYYNIADLIKHICLLFYRLPFDSSILTNAEQGTFLEMLSQNKRQFNSSWNLIYRFTSSNDDNIFNNHSFEKACNGRPNLMCFIHTGCDEVYGGYTSTGWKSDFENGTYTADKESFIFSIRSNKCKEAFLMNVKKNYADKCMGHHHEYCCIFGFEWDMYVRFLNK